MKKPSSRNIKTAESVNITPEDEEYTRRLMTDADFCLRLVDIIFGFDYKETPPS